MKHTTNSKPSSLLKNLIFASYEAGEAIMKIYQKEDLDIKYKKDDSPVTKADKKAQDIICDFLQEKYPDIPIISEESKEIPYEERKHYKKFFLVDPLDGTKGFIRGSDEFTVNIALIKNHEPVVGLIYLPTEKIVYYAEKGMGAWKMDLSEIGISSPEKLSSNAIKLPIHKNTEKIALISSSHASDEMKLYDEMRLQKIIPMHSARKFCELAEGNADIYIRSKPTMEWDTAAGQIIVEEVGFKMTTLDGKPFLYNKKSLVNSGFSVSKIDTTD